jgi:hypothetical protein
MLMLAACSGPIEPISDAAPLCRGDQMAITAVQGEGITSPLAETIVTVRGIATRVEQGKGFYLEEWVTAGNASSAVFIADEALSQTVSSGQDIAVKGRVEELGAGQDTLTSLADIAEHGICADEAERPLTRVTLPLVSRQREALEGMRLAFEGPLFFTDHYEMFRGEWTLSSEAPLRVPTEDAAPGGAAAALAQENHDRAIRIVLPGPDFPALPIGAGISHVQGVLGHDGKAQRLLLESTPRASASDIKPIDSPTDDSLRIVSMNLLNYFNGDGRGGGFPTARGAQSLADFQAQQERTAAAIARLRPHLLAVQELENDGFGPDSAARSLLDLLIGTGNSDWAVVEPAVGRIGGDVITVGLFYRSTVLEPLGPAELLQGPAFDGLSRVPVAQLFRERSTGDSFLVAVNHLKSKGRCPDVGPDTGQGDGQGCWNRARLDAVNALLPWLNALAEKSTNRQVLILGDMNAWRLEDPIRAFRAGGYIELVEELSGLPQYSFVYFGQRGTLDYALASPSLRARTRQATIWHSNADWPRKMSLPQPWLRMSDHDPVVIDLEPSQSATSD